MTDIVKRLRWPDIAGWDDNPKGVALRIEAADEIERLTLALRSAGCPGGGYTGQPKDEEPTVDACLKAGVCGCSLGAALSAAGQRGGGEA